MSRPGMTIAAPTIGAVKPKDQPLAWKSGTAGIMVSAELSPAMSACAMVIAWSVFERWV